MMNALKIKSEFTRNVFTLMTGTIIGQAIPIAITPILSRMYTPKDFGVFALFISVSTIASVVANGKYELAIMLPKREKDAINLCALSFIITFIYSSLLLIIIIVFHSKIINYVNSEAIGVWLYFVPLIVFFICSYNILKFYNNRLKKYKDIAKANVLKSIVLVTIQLLVFHLVKGATGLISGEIASRCFANLKLFNNIFKDKKLLSYISLNKMIVLAKKYKKFPLFTCPASLANSISNKLYEIILPVLYEMSTLGFYSMSMRTLSVPGALIGDAIGQVFFREASKEKNETGKAIKSFNSALIKLLLIGLPTYGLLFFIIEDLFAFILSEKWRIAGKYAQILIPLCFMQFIVGPLTYMNQINLKNKLGMYWQLGLVAITFIILYFVYIMKFEFKEMLQIYVFFSSLYYMFFLYLINKHTKKNNE